MLKSPLPSRGARALGLGAVIALSLGGAAAAWAAQSPAARGDVDPNATPTIKMPVWMEKPGPEDIVRLYPAEAARLRVSGQTLLTCRVKDDGRFDSCAVTRTKADGYDDPDGFAADFGTASLRLALLFRMAPEDRERAKTAGGIVRIPIRWIVPAS